MGTGARLYFKQYDRKTFHWKTGNRNAAYNYLDGELQSVKPEVHKNFGEEAAHKLPFSDYVM
jgi:hypothetical protein